MDTPSMPADARGQSCTTAYFFPVAKTAQEPAGILYVLKTSGETYALRCSRETVQSSTGSTASLREVIVGGMTEDDNATSVEMTEF